MGGIWVQFCGGQGACGSVNLVLRECIWNASRVSFVLSSFKDIGSLGSPPRRVVYHPSVSTLVTVSRFLVGNREALHFYFFVFFCLSFSPIPMDITP